MEKIVSSAADQQDILNALQSALNEKQQQQNLVSNAANISNASISNGTLEQLLGQTTNQNQQNNADANSNNNSNKLQTLTQEQLEQLTGINQSNNNGGVRNNNRQQGIVEILSAAAQINNTNSNNNSNNKQLDFSQIISAKNNNNVVRQQQLQLNSLTELQPVSTLLSGRRNQNQIGHYQNNSEQNQQNSVQLPSLVLSTQQQQVNSSSAENFNVIYRDACNMAGANRWMVANGNEQNKTQNWIVWRHNSIAKDE